MLTGSTSDLPGHSAESALSLACVQVPVGGPVPGGRLLCHHRLHAHRLNAKFASNY